MAMAEVSWRAEIHRASVTVVGAATATELQQRWHEWAAEPGVSVAVVGPFNSGKSSLIRRLLADEGSPVPNWLTVNARPETTRTGRVSSAGLTFIDSPGMHSGNLDHDAQAGSVLDGADAVMVVLPPQVLKEYAWVRSLCDGTWWTPAGGRLLEADSLLIVIGRTDSFGLYPPDAPEEFQNLCRGKQQELVNALDLSAGAVSPGYFTVAQDPFAGTAEEPSPTAADYDAFREWDGVGALAEALRALPAQAPALRSAAEIRYWAATGRSVLVRGEAEAAGLRALVEEAELRERRLKVSRESLMAISRAARADLVAQLEAELHSATVRTLSSSGPGYGERLDACVTRWAQEHYKRAEMFAGELERELGGRQAALSVRALDAWISAITDHSDQSTDPGNSRLVRLVKDLGQHGKELVDAHYSLRLGMTTETANDLIKAFDKAKDAKESLGKVATADSVVGERLSGVPGRVLVKPLQKVKDVMYRRGRLDSPEEIEWARALLRRSDATKQFIGFLSIVGPPAFDFGSDFLAQRKERQRRAAKAAEARALVQEIVPEVMGSAESRTGWEGLMADLRDALAIHPDEEMAINMTRERLTALDAACENLRTLLTSVPQVGGKQMDLRTAKSADVVELHGG
jgi:hypothetical protein